MMNRNKLKVQDVVNYSDELGQELIKEAKKYQKAGLSFKVWISDIGWEDWMYDEYFWQDYEDDGEIPESVVERIDEYLLGAREAAEERVEGLWDRFRDDAVREDLLLDIYISNK